MNGGNNEFTVRRILIPLDAAEHSLAALETAAEIAALQNAELEGLFVEDINILQLCQFPFAREVSLLGPAVRQISRSDVEMHLRTLARRVQRALAEAAERRKLRWRFRVVRGGVPAEILAAAAKADLTILGKAGWSRLLHPKMGSTVRTIVSKGQGLTLIVQRGVRLEAVASVMFTGSSLSEKALSLAGSLSRVKGIELLVFLLGREAGEQERLRERAGDIAGRQGVRPGFRRIADPSFSGLVRTVRSIAPGPLFLPCEAPLFRGETLQRLINTLTNPVFLVRPSRREGEMDQ